MGNITLSKEITKSEQNKFWKRNIFNVIATSSSVECSIANGHVMIVNHATIFVACLRPPQNVELEIFTSWSCRDGKEMYDSVLQAQRCFFWLNNIMNLLLFGRSRCRRCRSGLKVPTVKSRLAWENSRHLATLTLVFPPNDVWETRAEIPHWWRVTNQMWVVLLIGWIKFPTRREQSEALPRAG